MDILSGNNFNHRKYIANPGGVMMQAFLLDVPAGGNWWNTLSTKVTAPIQWNRFYLASQ
jgi:hypothetical protein